MKVGNFFKKDSMSCSCLDADKSNAQPEFDGCMAF